MRKTESRSITFPKTLWNSLDELDSKDIIHSISFFIVEAVKEKLINNANNLRDQAFQFSEAVRIVKESKTNYRPENMENMTSDVLLKFAEEINRVARMKKYEEENIPPEIQVQTIPSLDEML